MPIGEPQDGSAHARSANCRCAPGLGRAAWRALRDSAGCGVWVLDAEGRYAYVNAVIAAGLARPASDLVGSRLADHFPAEFVKERLDIIRRVLSSRKPVSYLTEFHGQPYVVHFRPILSPNGAPPTQVLGVGYHPAPGTLVSGDEIRAPRHIDRGQLSVLTDRELEVLKLIAHGLPYAEIAARLNRTLKTVEAHRSSLGRKLGVRNRSQLVLIAVQNGLVEGPRIEQPVRPLPSPVKSEGGA